MKLFPAKISERESFQKSMTVHCYLRMLTKDFRYSEVFVEFQAFNLPAI